MGQVTLLRPQTRPLPLPPHPPFLTTQMPPDMTRAKTAEWPEAEAEAEAAMATAEAYC